MNDLLSPDTPYPIVGEPVVRPPARDLELLRPLGSATVGATLHKMGVRRTFIEGPLPQCPGSHVTGPAITLQLMPRREDFVPAIPEQHHVKKSALWQVLDTIEPGDILVIQAGGDRQTGILGDILSGYFHDKGGAAIVVDGCLRDWPDIQKLSLPVWSNGFTPNHAWQGDQMPWAYHVPIACGGVLVLPGDIIVADDDGAVLVPAKLASEVATIAADQEGWEEFGREQLAAGKLLERYYPLADDARDEYEAWKRQRRNRDE
ncbi:MAG: ribonuclease activity regulator RraA [Planctomycetaceae bacterium]|nr:ribonuclease activity regulator RraA [Planctomycetaceae bacterium]MBP63293.1 ribonuclease activity regulator RraA [Planctomycetaceae bacterium]